MSQPKDAKSAPGMRMQAAISSTPCCQLLCQHHTAAQYVLTIRDCSMYIAASFDLRLHDLHSDIINNNNNSLAEWQPAAGHVYFQGSLIFTAPVHAGRWHCFHISGQERCLHSEHACCQQLSSTQAEKYTGCAFA